MNYYPIRLGGAATNEQQYKECVRHCENYCYPYNIRTPFVLSLIILVEFLAGHHVGHVSEPSTQSHPKIPMRRRQLCRSLTGAHACDQLGGRERLGVDIPRLGYTLAVGRRSIVWGAVLGYFT